MWILPIHCHFEKAPEILTFPSSMPMWGWQALWSLVCPTEEHIIQGSMCKAGQGAVVSRVCSPTIQSFVWFSHELGGRVKLSNVWTFPCYLWCLICLWFFFNLWFYVCGRGKLHAWNIGCPAYLNCTGGVTLQLEPLMTIGNPIRLVMGHT